MPDEPEALGLLALMLFHDARREARTAPTATLVLLAEQDRRRWNRERIAEGVRVLERAMSLRSPGPYQLQAAIGALHVEADGPRTRTGRRSPASTRRSPQLDAVADRRAQPRRRRRDGRGPERRARAGRRDRPAGLPPPATRPAPICSAGSTGWTRPRSAYAEALELEMNAADRALPRAAARPSDAARE